jgi:hypothetical protein
MADQSHETPNPLVVEAFKPVIGAALEFALLDDARRDGLTTSAVPIQKSTSERSSRALTLCCWLVMWKIASARNRTGMRKCARLLRFPRSRPVWPYLNGVFHVLRERSRRGP